MNKKIKQEKPSNIRINLPIESKLNYEVWIYAIILNSLLKC